MGYTTEELQVPVKLRVNNLQEIINELSGQLSTLKIGSKGFKDVENIFIRIRGEMDKLQVQISKPFVNQRQFITAEHSIEKIEDGLAQAQLVMSRLKFSDLNLNSEQTEKIRQFNEEINNIKNNIKNVKEITKQSFLGTDIGKAWLGIDPNAVSQNLNQITQSIISAFTKQKKAIDDIEAKFKEYENNLSLKNKINDFINQLNSVSTVKSSSAIFQGIYDQIFNAQGKFQNGGQTILAQWLSKEFELNEAQVSALIQGTASKVIASLKSGQLQELITSKLGSLQQSTSTNYNIQLKQELEEAHNLLTILTPIYNEVSSAQFGVSAATKQLEAALKSANTQLEIYKQEQAAAAGTNESWKTSINRSRQTLQQFKEQLQQTESNFLAMERTQRNFQSIKMLITNFMGFTQVLNLVKTGVRNALNHIKELDTVMNKIAIVTNMSNSDLWKQIDSYSAMSQKYGVSIKGAYEVSQIYYQQGLQTNDVLTLTNETLKLSKISGLDYAQTTDYMTTALRGFKMEMSEASTVVDVYSNLAAHTAVSQEELAIAMSKTASSLESVGSTFEEGSAMIGTMVAVTRESATNIGSAMKSIAARYGEMKSDPNAISDIEGEAIAYNKVDAALQSVGISLKDSQGQFRNFTDVIIELGEKWDQLENTQQRYIATQFAGNRQQSRFLALISNIDLLKANLSYAENAEDIGDIQALKALDSIETKIEQVKVAYQEMYTTIGAEDIWKFALDSTKNFINTLNGLPKLFGTVPIGAIAMIADVVKVVKDLGFSVLGGISKVWAQAIPDKFGAIQGHQIGEDIAQGLLDSLKNAREALKQAGQEASNAVVEGAQNAQKDLNQPAGKEQQPEKSATVQTTQTIAVEDVSKTEQVASAAITTANAMTVSAEQANKMSNAVEATVQNAKDTANTLTEINNVSKYTISYLTKYLQDTSEGYNLGNGVSLNGWIMELKERRNEFVGEFSTIPDDIIRSIVLGLINGQGIVGDAAETLVSKIVPRIQEVLNMHSPSPTIIAMFENGVGDAIAIGLESSSKVVIAAAAKLGLSVSEALKENLNKGEKIQLTDYYSIEEARRLIRGVSAIQSQVYEQNALKMEKQLDFLLKNNGSRHDIALTEQKLEYYAQRFKENQDAYYRMPNIKYENIPIKSLYIAHNFKDKNLGTMAGPWGGVIPSPSGAIKATNDKTYIAYGNSTAYLPPSYGDPNSGKSIIYRGDAATPVPMIKPGYVPTLDEVHARLARHEPVGFDLETNLLDFVRDATKMYSLPQILQQVGTITSMQFAAPPYGNKAYRISESMDDDKMDAWALNLTNALANYISKTNFNGASYNIGKNQSEATYNGAEAYTAAMYKTADEMGRLGHYNIDAVTQTLLSKNLIDIFKTSAKIDLSSGTQSEDFQNFINESLKYIQFAFQNPGHDYIETKAQGDVFFKELTGLLTPYNNLNQKAFSDAFAAGLDPRRTFFYDESITSGPLSRTSISNYMLQNIPGIAFDENGPLVQGDIKPLLNIDELKNTLSTEALNLPPIKVDAIVDAANSIMDNDMGQVLSNTLKAALSNVDFSAEDAAVQVSQIIQTISSQMMAHIPQLQAASTETAQQIVAGLALGLSSNLANATTSAEGIGKAIIAALNTGAGVASPSIFAFSSGKFIMLGLTNGMMAGAEEALDQALKLGKHLIIQLDTGINNESGKGIEKIKNRLHARLAALTEVTDEEKAKISNAINNLTWDNDYVKAIRNSNLAGIDGTVTQEGIRYVTSHPILAGEMVQTPAPTLSTQPMIEQAQAAKTVIENTAAPTVQEHLDTTAVKSEAEIAKKEIEAIQQNYNVLSPEAIIARGSAIRDTVLDNRQSNLFMYTNPELQARERTSSYELDIEKAHEVLNIYLQIQELRKATDATTAGSDTYNKLQELYQSVGTTDRLSDSSLLERINGLREALGEVIPAAAETGTQAGQALNANIVTTVAEAGTEAGQALGKNMTAAIETTSNEIPAPKTDEVETAMNKVAETAEAALERVKKAWSNMDFSTDNEIMEAMQNGDVLYGMHEGPSFGKTLPIVPIPKSADSISSIEIDTTAAVAQLSALIDKLVEIGVLSEETGAKLKASLEGASPEELANKMKELEASVHAVGSAGEQTAGKLSKINFGTIGSAIRMLANISGISTQAKGAITALGGAITLVGIIISAVDAKTKGIAMSNPWMAIAMGVMALINGISQLWETSEEKLQRLTKESEELINKAKEAKSNVNNISNAKKELEDLEDKRYDSADAAEEYKEKVEDLTTKFPALIKGFDEAGEAIINSSDLENSLTEAREKSAQATYEAAKAELERLKVERTKKVEDLAKKSSKLTHRDNDTGEETVVDENTYYRVLSDNINSALPEWLSDSYYAVSAGNSLSNQIYNDMIEKQNPLDNFGVYLATSYGRVKENLGLSDIDQQQAVYDLYNSVLANYIQDYNKIDYNGILWALNDLKNSHPKEYSTEADDLLNFLEILLQANNEISEFGGSTMKLAERVDEIQDTRLLEQLKSGADDISIINDAVKKYNESLESENAAEINQAYNYIKTVINEIRKTPGAKYLFDYVNTLESSLEEVGSALDELNGTEDSIEAATKQMVSTAVKNRYETENFIADQSGLLPIISNRVLNKFESSKTTKPLDEWLRDDGFSDLQTLISDASSFWGNLGPENKKLFSKIIKDNKYYSDEELFEIFGDFGLKSTTELGKELTDYYKEIEAGVNERIVKKLTSEKAILVQLGKVFDDDAIAKIDTVAEENYFNTILDTLNELTKHGYENAAESYRTNAGKLFTTIESVSAQARVRTLSLIEENGLNTQEGLISTIDSIESDNTIKQEDKDRLKKSLTSVKDTILSNLNLELQVAVDNFLTTWEDSSKILSKLSSGIDLKDTQGLIQSDTGKAIKLNINDFISDGDKLILSADKIDEYLTQYFLKEQTKLRTYESTIGKILKSASWLIKDESGNITAVDHAGGWSVDEIEELKKVTGIDIADYAEKLADGTWKFTNEKRKEFDEAVINGIKTSHDNLVAYGDYLSFSQKQITKKLSWDKGDYSSLNDIYKKFESYSDLDDLLSKSVQARITNLVSGIERMTDEELEQPDIVNAVKQIQSAYSTYINDLISKDINTLYAQNYVQTGRGKNKIINEMENAQDRTAMDFARWIAGLAEAAGQSLTEQNDAFIKAWEKTHAKDTLDGVKDIQFLDNQYFSATTQQLKTFADTYNLSINELVNQGYAAYDEAMDSWIINYKDLDANYDNVDFNSIIGFQETVTDSVNSFFDRISELIEKALKGSLNELESLELKNYAKKLGLSEEKLIFSRTTEGLGLETQSALALQEKLNNVNRSYGNKTFSFIKDSLISNDDRFQSISRQAAEEAQLIRNIRGINMINSGIVKGDRSNRTIDFFNQQRGNVDLYNRKKLYYDDGSYSTLLTSTLDSRNFETDIPFAMNITPIPPDAKSVEDILSDEDLNNYIQELLDKNPINGEALLELDKVENGGKGLIINLKEADEVTEDLVNSMDREAQILHEISEIYEAIQDGEQFDTTKIDQYEKELQLVREIMRVRSTTEDDSFKFMEQKIPSGQNNPLNFWANWGKAFSAINDSIKGGKDKTGYMAYEDFYNLITELGHIASITGNAVSLGEKIEVDSKNVADLIELAGGHLVTMSDGSIKIDLSAIGIDFQASAEAMSASVDDGIHLIAQSEIDMLDSMISVLETVVAMEKLGDIDTNHDLEISIPEIGVTGIDENGLAYFVSFSKEYSDAKEMILQNFGADSDEDAVLAKVKANGHTLKEIFNMSTSELNKIFNPQQYSKLLSNLYKISKSDKFDINNPWESFLNLYNEFDWSGLNLSTIDKDHAIVLNDTGSYTIEWSSDSSKKKMREALEEWSNKSDDELATLAQEAVTANENGTLTVKQNYLLKVLEGQIQVQKDEEGKTQYVVNGHAYNTYSDAVAASDMLNAGFTKEEFGVGDNTGTAIAKLEIDDQIIRIISTGNGKLRYRYNNKEYPDKNSALAALYESQNEGKKAFDEEGLETEDFKKAKVEYGVEVMPTYQFKDDSQVITKKAQEQARTLINKAINSGNPQDWENVEKNLNITLNPSFKSGEASIQDIADLKAAFGIEDKVVDLDAHVVSSGDIGLAEAINTKQAIIDVTANVNQEAQSTNTVNAETESLIISLKSGAQPQLNPDQQLSIDLLGKIVTATNANIQITPTADNIDFINNLSTIKVNDALAVTTDAVTVDLLGKVLTAINAFIQITPTKDNIDIINNLNSIEVDDTLAVKAKASIIDVSITDSTHTQFVPTENPPDAGYLPEVSATAEHVTVNMVENSDFGTRVNLDLNDNQVLALSDKIPVAGKASRIDAIMTKETKVGLGYGEDTDPTELVNIGQIQNASASIVSLQIDKVEQYRVPDDLTAVAEITAGLNDLASEPIAALQTDVNLLEDSDPIITVTTDNHDANSDIWDTIELSDDLEYADPTVEVDTDNHDANSDMWDTIELAGDINNLAPVVAVDTEVDTTEITENLDNVIRTIKELNNTEAIVIPKAKAEKVKEELNELIQSADVLDAIDPVVTIRADDSATSLINGVRRALDDLVSGVYKLTVQATVRGNEGRTSSNTYELEDSEAKGNTAHAKGTLMGELGPELVVQNGHYFVAGQNGAEFVDLMDDAIVFNHLQTQQLLKNGMSNSRGRALTNERIAASYAHGNVSGGLAMASASQALNALKQLRAMWKSLQDMSSKDLLGAGGGGGGGGGGKDDMASFLKDLERWYNWLQRIAQLETEINYQEQLRSKIESDMIAHGQDYFNSQLVSLGKIEDQIAVRQDLLNSQQEYFNARREELNTRSPFSSLYTFDETGQLKYREGAFNTLSEILSADEYGQPKYTTEEQYNKLLGLNPDFANYMKYDKEGKEIKWTDDQGNPNPDAYTTAVEAFWEKVDADKEEMQSLHDSIEELKVDILENFEAINEILHDIEENQIDVENMVLKAIEDSRQREIDELQDTRDAIEDSNSKLIQGLQDQLDNEQKMYEAQASSEDLTKLQRQLAILQRSGASAADISNLQNQITDKQSDMYFDAQERQIDAIQQASDAQLERLDAQIDLMTETLAYEKENGLLWKDVYDQMLNKTPEEIESFIREHDSSLWGESPTEQIKTDRENIFKLQRWVEFTDKFSGLQDLIDHFTKPEVGTETLSEEAQAAADAINGITTKNASEDAQAKAPAVLPDNSSNQVQNGTENNKTQATGQKYKAFYTVTGVDKNNNKPIEYKGYGIGNTREEAILVARNLGSNFIKTKLKSLGARFKPGEVVQYERGGMVKDDGEGYLHANEGVLTPEQTSTLRNEILGNKPNSLLSLLMTWRDSVMGIADTSSISNYSGVNIEKAEVIMQVSHMSNDYDAQRAGEQALDKIMSIARKTMAQNRIGR